MLRTLLVAFSVAAVASGRGRPDQTNCDSTAVNKCLADLSDRFLQDMSRFLRDPAVFDSVLKAQYQYNYTSVQFVVNVCNGMSYLYGCLGKQNIQFCLGVSGLSYLNVDVWTAYQFEGKFNRVRFECGDAIYPMIQDPNVSWCFQNTKVNYDDVMQQYYTAYQQNIQHDDFNNVCDHAQALVSGISGVWDSGVCRTVNRDIGTWIGCEGARQHVLGQFRHCAPRLRCTPAAPNQSDALPATVRVSTSGEYEYLIPSYLTRSESGELTRVPEAWVKNTLPAQMF